MSSHTPDNLEHVYNKCSTFSSWLLHILQIQSVNVICFSLISVLIHPWNNFQLKSWHFLGIHALVKFTRRHISQSIMVLKSLNLLDQYSLGRTDMSLLFTKILYISLAVKECNGFRPSPGIWNMVFKILLSFVFCVSSDWSILSHSAGKDLRIVCISNMNPALYISLWYNWFEISSPSLIISFTYLIPLFAQCGIINDSLLNWNLWIPHKISLLLFWI